MKLDPFPWLVQEHRGECQSIWAAVESIALKIGSVPHTLLDRVKRVRSTAARVKGNGVGSRLTRIK